MLWKLGHCDITACKYWGYIEIVLRCPNSSIFFCPAKKPYSNMKVIRYILCITSLIVSSVATGFSNDHSCLNSTEARRIMNTWLPLNVQPPSAWLNNPYYNDTTMRLLAPNFQLYSDSDNYVGSPPPDNPVRYSFHANRHILKISPASRDSDCRISCRLDRATSRERK